MILGFFYIYIYIFVAQFFSFKSFFVSFIFFFIPPISPLCLSLFSFLFYYYILLFYFLVDCRNSACFSTNFWKLKKINSCNAQLKTSTKLRKNKNYFFRKYKYNSPYTKKKFCPNAQCDAERSYRNIILSSL